MNKKIEDEIDKAIQSLQIQKRKCLGNQLHRLGHQHRQIDTHRSLSPQSVDKNHSVNLNLKFTNLPSHFSPFLNPKTTEHPKPSKSIKLTQIKQHKSMIENKVKRAERNVQVKRVKNNGQVKRAESIGQNRSIRMDNWQKKVKQFKRRNSRLRNKECNQSITYNIKIRHYKSHQLRLDQMFNVYLDYEIKQRIKCLQSLLKCGIMLQIILSSIFLVMNILEIIYNLKNNQKKQVIIVSSTCLNTFFNILLKTLMIFQINNRNMKGLLYSFIISSLNYLVMIIINIVVRLERQSIQQTLFIVQMILRGVESISGFCIFNVYRLEYKDQINCQQQISPI